MMKFSRFLVFVLFFFTFCSLTYAYPQIIFTETSYSAGQVDVSGQASFGTKVLLRVNDNFVGTQDVNPTTSIVSLSGAITDLNLPQGVTLTFENQDSARTYRLDFVQDSARIGYNVVAPGSSFTFEFAEAGSVSVTDDESSETATYTIEDQLGDFTFTNIPQSYLEDGENTFDFEVIYSLGGAPETLDEQATVNYEQFTNTISLNSPPALSTDREVTLRGFVSEASMPLYYTKNFDGEIVNIGSLTPVELDGNNFEVTISLGEGENDIRFVTLASDTSLVITGELVHSIEVDTSAPSLDLLEVSFQSADDGVPVDFSEDIYISDSTIFLTYATDAQRLVFSLNDRDPNVPLVSESSLQRIDYLNDYTITSDGNTMSFVFVFSDDASSGSVDYEYNGRGGSQDVVNNEVSFDINLDEDDSSVELTFSDGTESEEVVLQIQDYAFEEFPNAELGEVEVVEGIAEIELSLSRGRNDLTVFAYDAVGNEAKEARPIFYDDQKPQLIRESLRPEEIFTGSRTSRSFFQRIQGQVNKPDVHVRVFSLPEDAAVPDFEGNGENQVTCDDFKILFARDLGQLDRDVVRRDSPELNLEEQQLSIGLQSLIFAEDDDTTDAEGNFEVVIGLQERSFDRTDLNDAQRDTQQRIDTVVSRNDICFVLTDRFGNVEIESFRVNLDAGNTQWRPGEITTTPNTLYASEIEMTGDQRQGLGRQRFGMIVRFQYIGGGVVSDLENFRVVIDRTVGLETRGSPRVVSSEVNYMMDKDTGELVTYVPVELSPLGIPAADYPSSLEIGFAANVEYEVDNNDIPIDTRNPIYFRTEINIERPFDHTKWLTPETIDKTLDFLNKTTQFTEKAVKWTRIGSVAGVLTCTGAKFFYSAKMATAANKKEREEAERQLFMICDRVACSKAPDKCEDFDPENFDHQGQGVLELNDGYANGYSVSSENLLGRAQITSESKDREVIAQFNSLSILGLCDFDGDGKTDDGVSISGQVTNYEYHDGQFLAGTSQSEQLIRTRCVKRQTVDGKNYLDLKEVSNVCFNNNPPHYDGARCNFFTLDGKEGVPELDPSDNLLESIRCGCITDTYSHLKTMLRVQQGIQKCLEQAKIGNVKGAYCERLMGIAICDLATNILFESAGQDFGFNKDRETTDGVNPRSATGFAATMDAIRKEERRIDDRYRGTLLSQTGLSTDQIVNKACLAALTGDISVLSENILNSVEQNEVEPVFGPPFPTSRMLGYNPFTGELTIDYRFTYGAISGGQIINTKVEFVCDKDKPNGGFCPSTPIVSSEGSSDSRINVRNLFVREGGTVQDLVVVTDSGASYWFNVLRLTHTYQVKGQSKTLSQEFKIDHRGEKLANCHWSAGVLGAGSEALTCDSIFTDEALISSFRINDRLTEVIPDGENTVLYPGNPVLVNLNYRTQAQDSLETGFDLAWEAVCRQAGGGGTTSARGYVPNVPAQRNGNEVVSLFSIPDELGETTNQENTRYTVQLTEDDKLQLGSGGEIIFTNSAGTSGSTSGINVNIIDANFELKDDGGNSINSLTIISDKKSYDISSILSPTEGIPELYLVVEGNQPGLQISFEYGKEESTVSKPFSTGNKVFNEADGFTNLGEGQCTLKLRALPLGHGEGITAREVNFDDYDPFANENIDIDPSLRDEGKFQTRFIIQNEPEGDDDGVNFAFTFPREDETICFNPGEEAQQNLEYILTTANDDLASKSYSIEFILKPVQYGVNIGNETAKDNMPSTYTLSVRDNVAVGTDVDFGEIPVVLPPNYVDNAGELMEGTLTYTMKVKDSNDVIVSDNMNINIKIASEGEQCVVR